MATRTFAYIPPSGFIGSGSQTMATQLVQLGSRRAPQSTRRRKRKSATKRTTKRASSAKRRTKRASSRPARLVKGSAAAKRYMAKIRKMRK